MSSRPAAILRSASTNAQLRCPSASGTDRDATTARSETFSARLHAGTPILEPSTPARSEYAGLFRRLKKHDASGSGRSEIGMWFADGQPYALEALVAARSSFCGDGPLQGHMPSALLDLVLAFEQTELNDGGAAVEMELERVSVVTSRVIKAGIEGATPSMFSVVPLEPGHSSATDSFWVVRADVFIPRVREARAQDREAQRETRPHARRLQIAGVGQRDTLPRTPTLERPQIAPRRCRIRCHPETPPGPGQGARGV
jgi:hypothetical protein